MKDLEKKSVTSKNSNDTKMFSPQLNDYGKTNKSLKTNIGNNSVRDNKQYNANSRSSNLTDNQRDKSNSKMNKEFTPKSNYNLSISRLSAHQYEHKIQDLLELVEVQENKMNTQQENKYKLLNKLKDTDEERNNMYDKINNLNKQKLNQGKEIIDLSHKLIEYDNKYKSVSFFLYSILSMLKIS